MPITRRQKNEDIAPVSQDLGEKSAMPFDIAGKRVFGHWKQTLR